MKIEFDPGLVEEIIFKELKAREGNGVFSLTDEYHSFTDPIYENFPAEEQPAQFKKIDWDFFKKLGFPKVIKEIFDEFPEFEKKVSGGVVARATNPFDEGSNVITKGQSSEGGEKKVVLKLLSDRFLDIPFLTKLMRHELMHVSDMLRDDFCYTSERLGCNPMEESIIKERYSVFWDIFVDSRLIRKGKETVSDKQSRYSEFETLYKKIPSEVKVAIFDALWQDEFLTHGRILDLAKDVNKVIKIAEGLPIKHVQKHKKTILPGSQCPLCRFRTYNWVENIEQDTYLIDMIKKDFPDWEPEDGVCERCLEAYKVRIPVC